MRERLQKRIEKISVFFHNKESFMLHFPECV